MILSCYGLASGQMVRSGVYEYSNYYKKCNVYTKIEQNLGGGISAI